MCQRNSLAKKWHSGHASWGENGTNVRLFFSLAIGYLLGLYQHERISDDEFKVGELQIPGIIMMHLPRLIKQPV